MPSIRIKGPPGQVYSALEDAISVNDDTLCLRGEVPGAPQVQHRSSFPLLPRGLLDMPSPPLHGRPRSASSRIHAHCINASRNSQHWQLPPNPLSNTKSTSTSNPDNATTQDMTIEGALTNVRVPSHIDPGFEESSIGISLTNDDEDSQFSGHHHDEVVEHLDVIGDFPFFSHLNLQK